MLIPEALVADTLDQNHALGAIYRLGYQLNELLGVLLEVVQPSAVDEDLDQAPPGQVGLVLKVGQKVRQLDIMLVNGDRR